MDIAISVVDGCFIELLHAQTRRVMYQIHCPPGLSSEVDKTQVFKTQWDGGEESAQIAHLEFYYSSPPDRVRMGRRDISPSLNQHGE